MPRESLERAELASRRLAPILARVMPEGWGFVLVLTTLGENKRMSGRVTYIANIHREDVPTALRALADKLEFGWDGV